MTTIGYIRISKDVQDLNKQRHLLLEYSQQQKILIDEFIEIEIPHAVIRLNVVLPNLSTNYMTAIFYLWLN